MRGRNKQNKDALWRGDLEAHEEALDFMVVGELRNRCVALLEAHGAHQFHGLDADLWGRMHTAALFE